MLLLGFTPALAQRMVNHQSLYWIRYQNQLIFSPQVYWNIEFDNRRFFGTDVENQFIFHSKLHYKKKSWDFGGGITASWIFAQKPENGYTHAAIELRPVIEASHELRLGSVGLQNRIRIDNRFLEEDPDISILKASSYVMRFRYRLQARVPLKKNAESLPVIVLRVADELMFNHTKNTFDQHRINVSTDFFISKALTLEVGYVYIYQQRFGSDNEFFQRNVARFSLIHKITRT
jgi:hypothetical protein